MAEDDHIISRKVARVYMLIWSQGMCILDWTKSMDLRRGRAGLAAMAHMGCSDGQKGQ